MDILFLTKIYEERGYDEFVKYIEMAKKVDEEKLTTFSNEELLSKIHFLQKTNDIFMQEIQRLKPTPPILEEDSTPPPKIESIPTSSKSKDYAQALLTILKKKSPEPVIQRDIRKNIIYEVLRMDKTFMELEDRLKTFRPGSKEISQVVMQMNKVEKEKSILISRMATFARRGHEASKVPEENSITVGTFSDGSNVKLHRLTRNLFTEDIMDENGDILNIDFIKFYHTYEKNLGKFEVIWYTLTDEGRRHFQKCIDDSSINKFVDLATYDLLDRIVPLKPSKK